MYVRYQVIGKNHVAVPTHFFKVVILEKQRGEVELRPYVMPNIPVDEKIPLERFLVPIESIGSAVRPQHPKEDQQPAGHYCQGLIISTHGKKILLLQNPWSLTGTEKHFSTDQV